MKIKLKINLGTDWPPYREDEVVDAEDDVGSQLVQRGWATIVESETTVQPQADPPTEKLKSRKQR